MPSCPSPARRFLARSLSLAWAAAVLSVTALPTAVLSTAASAQCLTTIYARNNGGSNGGAVYFDLQVINPAGITVTSLDTNTADLVSITLDVYTVAGSYIGNETNASAWTLASSGTGFGQGNNIPTSVDVADFPLTMGNYGIALVMGSSSGHDYTNGAGTFSNADISLSVGAASNVPFTGSPFTPRTWNGTVYYTAPGALPCATALSYGTGCGPAPLTLTAVGLPQFGATVGLNTTNVPAGTQIGAVALGLAIFDPGISLGAAAPGCFQHCTLDAPLLWFPSGTTASSSLFVPNNMALVGVELGSQSISLTPGLNPLNIAASNGIALKVGT